MRKNTIILLVCCFVFIQLSGQQLYLLDDFLGDVYTYSTERDTLEKITPALIEGDIVGIHIDHIDAKIYLTEKAFFGGDEKIVRMDLDGSNAEVFLTDSIEDPVHVRIDHVAGKVFWMQYGVSNYKILSADLDGSDRKLILDYNGVHNFRFMEINTFEQKLYLSDITRDRIRSLSYDGLVLETVFETLDNTQEIRDLAFYPGTNKIYFNLSSFGDGNMIASVNTDGSSYDTIALLGSDLQPNGIELDTINQLIYWTAKDISDPSMFQEIVQRSNLDGSDRVTFVKPDSILGFSNFSKAADLDFAYSELDFDGDGFDIFSDCNDRLGAVNPAVSEVPYNGLDDDCNITTPDDDLDGDGYFLVDDCNDTLSNINPGAAEIPNNGIDEDCDGMDLTSSTDEEGFEEVRIWPNPASDYIQTFIQNSDYKEVRIYDMLGRCVLLEDLGEKIEISHLENGNYLIQIVSDKSAPAIFKRLMIARE